MPEQPLEQPVTAQWDTSWLELPDDNLGRDVRYLIPEYLFGADFDVTAREELPDGLVRVSATVPRKIYTVMVRYQQGAESSGDDPPDFALVEGSATDVETGHVMGTGEVFPLR